jgi:hypothetical protein
VFLDSSDIVRAFVGAQIGLVSESSSACRTGKGTLVGGQMCGEVDGEGSLTDSSLGAEVTHVGAGSIV